MFYTYVLQSDTTGRLYIGQTNDLESRFRRHNEGRIFSTKNKGPWKIIYFRQFEKRNEAMAFEKKLKMLKNKDYLLGIVRSNLL